MQLDVGDLIPLKFKKTTIKYEIIEVQTDIEPSMSIVGFKTYKGKRVRFLSLEALSQFHNNSKTGDKTLPTNKENVE